MEKADIDTKLEAYRQCFESKHHYDNFSWTIAAVVVVLVGILLTIIPKITATPSFLTVPIKFLVAGVGWALLVLWARIYERNRFWGEVCNEKARDLEKEMHLDGLAHSFMRGALSGEIILKNTDIDGKPFRNAEPHLERCNANSVHRSIRVVIWVLAFALLASAVISYEI